MWLSELHIQYVVYSVGQLINWMCNCHVAVTTSSAGASQLFGVWALLLGTVVFADITSVLGIQPSGDYPLAQHKDGSGNPQSEFKQRR